jgi:ABC-type lipoprotein release transport system permease subunit
MFRTSLPWRWDVLASVIGVTLMVALLATTIPIRLVRKLEPAVILKGN